MINLTDFRGLAPPIVIRYNPTCESTRGSVIAHVIMQMAMEIEIHSYLSCSHKLETEPKTWNAIIILDSSLRQSNFVRSKSKRSLQLIFDDITHPASNKILPSKEQISECLNFATDADNLLVCCRAGQSRSAATAFTIAYEILGPETALALLNPKRHSPNDHILACADEIITRPGIINAYDDWVSANGDIRLTDYLDEIESEYDDLENMGASDRISHG